MIRKATLKDIDQIIEITKACAIYMTTRNIFQWNEHYPNKEAFISDVERDELYVLELENIIIGCITISILMDEEYIPITWLTNNKNNMYIHRLAIHPKHQGKGFAQKLMSYAENLARKTILLQLD